MKTNVCVESELLSDVSLVELSLDGDREAFGLIVSRYQAPICALAYCACGDVARSEDIAQEVFFTAWRKLSTLQQRERFRSWLYGIARNLIHNTFRRNARNPVVDAAALENVGERVSEADEPDEQAISREEEAILWHVLSGLPDVYREPMVLFYRQNESVPRVADVLDISEDSVRQRLSRGRALLSERVTRLLQNGLRKSGPGNAFAIAVIASLPVVAATTTAQGAVVGIATTKGAAGEAAGLFGFLKGIGVIAAFLAVPAGLGALCGRRLNLDAEGVAQHRRSAARFWRIFTVGIAALVFAPLLLTFFVTGFLRTEARALFLSAMTWWLALAYPFILLVCGFWFWERRRKSRSTAGSASEQPALKPARLSFGKASGLSRRAILLTTLAASALLVFCFLDMRHNVGHLTPAQLRELITQSVRSELTANIMETHPRSVCGDSSNTIRTFSIEVNKDGKKRSYLVPVDEGNVQLLAQKRIACPTYVQGRDFEVLGAPGRFLPVLAAFAIGLGAFFLVKRSSGPRPAGPESRAA